MEQIQHLISNKYVRLTGWVFAARLALSFLDPNFAFGRSLGFLGFMVLGLLIAVSVFLASVATYFFLSRLDKWSHDTRAFLAGSLVLSMALYFPLYKAADSDWGIGDFFTQQQIEYFCLKNFSRDRCVSFVLRCPRCAVEIDRWKRDLMNQKLKAHMQEPTQGPAATPRQPATARPK